MGKWKSATRVLKKQTKNVSFFGFAEKTWRGGNVLFKKVTDVEIKER